METIDTILADFPKDYRKRFFKFRRKNLYFSFPMQKPKWHIRAYSTGTKFVALCGYKYSRLEGKVYTHYTTLSEYDCKHCVRMSEAIERLT